MAAEPQLSDSEAHTKLCEDYETARKYKFTGYNYVKNPHRKIHDDSPQLDLNSIMMYPSDGYSKGGCSPQNKDACVLLQLIPFGNQHGQAKIPELIYWKGRPSDGDIAWLKQYYPAES
jgi:hypothetical protein